MHNQKHKVIFKNVMFSYLCTMSEHGVDLIRHLLKLQTLQSNWQVKTGPN